jgi:hypothetical protein
MRVEAGNRSAYCEYSVQAGSTSSAPAIGYATTRSAASTAHAKAGGPGTFVRGAEATKAASGVIELNSLSSPT